MRILGLSAYHSDSAAALVVDGQPVSAARECLHSKLPRDAALPLRAARSCLSRAGLGGQELDRVVFYEKPSRHFERTLVNCLRSFPRGGKGFAREMTRWLGDRLWVKGRLADEFGVAPRHILFVEHMLSHAACAYYSSPFDEAAVLVVDDLGEWATTAIAQGRGATLDLLHETHWPHSLGLAVAALTQFLGFDPGGNEGVLADLALHGRPSFVDQVAELLPQTSDGSPRVAAEHFDFGEGAACLFRGGFAERFGPPRAPGGRLSLDGRDANLAASVQAVVTERVLDLARHAHQATGCRALCFTGVLARNRGLVTALLERGPFENLFVPPAPGEAGAALGAALYVAHADGGPFPDRGSVQFPADEELALLSDPDQRPPRVAGGGAGCLLPALLRGEAVGWVRGPLEFAPESLGRRVALADPAAPDSRRRLLGALQLSEPFLTCRVALPAERLAEWVELPTGARRLAGLAQLQLQARPGLAAAAPGAVMPDGSVWVQAVEPDLDPDLHDLLLRFGAERGLPALLLTSLRLRGSVMPRSDQESLEILQRSGLVAMLIEDRLHLTPDPS